VSRWGSLGGQLRRRIVVGSLSDRCRIAACQAGGRALCGRAGAALSAETELVLGCAERPSQAQHRWQRNAVRWQRGNNGHQREQPTPERASDGGSERRRRVESRQSNKARMNAKRVQHPSRDAQSARGLGWAATVNCGEQGTAGLSECWLPSGRCCWDWGTLRIGVCRTTRGLEENDGATGGRVCADSDGRQGR
jgi:hypothetical protein